MLSALFNLAAGELHRCQPLAGRYGRIVERTDLLGVVRAAHAAVHERDKLDELLGVHLHGRLCTHDEERHTWKEISYAVPCSRLNGQQRICSWPTSSNCKKSTETHCPFVISCLNLFKMTFFAAALNWSTKPHL
eukprot:1835269-Pleurochrysis_carterae.AAC.2